MLDIQFCHLMLQKPGHRDKVSLCRYCGDGYHRASIVHALRTVQAWFHNQLPKEPSHADVHGAILGTGWRRAV